MSQSNQLIAEIYFLAIGTGTSKETKERKTNVYVSASDVEALMNIYSVPKSEKLETFGKVIFLQDKHNQIRPSRPLSAPKIKNKKYG